MKRVPLAQVTEDVKSCDPRKQFTEPFRYIDIASIDRKTKRIEFADLINPATAPSRARQLVRAGDVLVSTVRPNLNCVARADQKFDHSVASTGFTVLRPNPNALDGAYLFRWVQTPHFVREMVRQATGASYPAVSDNIVKLSRIPLPKLDEQKRIAAILDKADAIRRKREQAIQLADEFLRSLFLDMFGDPVRNPNGWPTLPLKSLCIIRSGVTKGRRIRGPVTEVPYMRVANVQDGQLDLDEIKTIPATKEEITRYLLVPGDILLTEGGDPDKLGRGAVWHGEIEGCIHQNHIFCVRLSNTKQLLPEFLSDLLGSNRGKQYFLQAAKQTTGIASINKTQLSNFPVLIPELNKQIIYSKTVGSIRKIEMSYSNGSSNIKDLTSVLAHRAFRG